MKKAIFTLLTAVVVSQFVQAEKMIISLGTFKNKSNASSKNFESLIDRMTDGIVNTRKFNVVDNSRLKELMDEHKKVDMGLSDAAEAPKRGKIKTAGYKIYGTVINIGSQKNDANAYGVASSKTTVEVELNVRFADVETGELLASKIVKAKKSVTIQAAGGQNVTHTNTEQTAIQDAIQAAADKVVNKLMELAYPTKIIGVKTNSVFINLTEERAKVGAIYQVFSVGEEMIDPDTGESLGGAEELLGEIVIQTAKPKFAVATPIAPLLTTSLSTGQMVRPISEELLLQRKQQKKVESARKFKSRF